MDKSEKKKITYPIGINSVIAFVVTLAIGLCLFFMNKLGNTNSEELNLLYYFRGVIKGDNGLIYSFAKGLGDNVFSDLSINCFDPLYLSLLFVAPSKIGVLYQILLVVRMAFASLTSSVYLYYRFKRGSALSNFKKLLLIGFSVGYGLIGLSNPSAFFTLGLLMVPIVSWGVYRIARGGRISIFLISIIASGLVNWYLGFVLLVLSLFVFIAEMVIASVDSNSFVNNRSFVSIIMRSLRFIICSIISVGATYALYGNAIKNIHKDDLLYKSVGFTGNILSIANLGALALVCLLLIFCISRASVAKKIILGILVILTSFMVYFTPFIRLMTLEGRVLKDYSFILYFALLFVVGSGILWYEFKSIKPLYIGILGGIVSALFIVLKYVLTGKIDIILISSMVLSVVLLVLINIFRDKNKIVYWICLGLMLLIIPSEKIINAINVPNTASTYSEEYKVFSSLINSIKTFDQGSYRISVIEGDKVKTTYSENGYLYFASDNSSGKLVKGLPLGSKYIITDQETDQFVMGELNQYKIIQNKAVVPMAFVFDGSDFVSDFENASEDMTIVLEADINRRKPSAMTVSEGSLKFKAEANEGEKLLVSVPFDSNWVVTVNGVRVNPVSYSGTFMTIDLNPGTNSIAMTYELDNFDISLIISLVAILLATAFILFEQYKIKVSSYEYIRNTEKS